MVIEQICVKPGMIFASWLKVDATGSDAIIDLAERQSLRAWERCHYNVNANDMN